MKLFIVFAWVFPTVLLLITAFLGVANLKIGFLAGVLLGVVAYVLNAVVAPEVLSGLWLMISQLWSLAGFLILLPWVITAAALYTGSWNNSLAAKSVETAKATYGKLSPEDRAAVKTAAADTAQMCAKAAKAYLREKGKK